MTADQLDTAINTYLWVDTQAGVYGPGLAVAASLWAACRTIRALRHAAHRVRLHLDLQRIEDHANQTPIREEKP
ncbi:hypothetical protein ADL07_11860 [Streptomyces sp. NRRL F-4707]|uniref:hypothetical protein n=1 Tax=Streptomyces sp. NRRL F-4707 TaxID=1519496 RepID=UPI0006AEB2D8|nr:hypothetical protein [Streptomyces sp. NRRL F-4707]KOX32842.1 hypothetical protein ADL07_11860 [Streptomyces sp. NRRL F-4707]